MLERYIERMALGTRMITSRLQQISQLLQTISVSVICARETVLTKYKVRQNERVYGFWNLNEALEASEGPLNVKKSRSTVDNESDPSDTSDQDSEKQPAFGLVDMLPSHFCTVCLSSGVTFCLALSQ